MEWGSFVFGAFIGAKVAKIVDLMWGKGERWIHKRRNPPLPWSGYIARIKRKDFRDN